MFGLTELPIAGRGIIFNNGGFYLLKVSKLFLKNGSVIHIKDYDILINTAKNSPDILTKMPLQNQRVVELVLIYL